MDASLFVPSSKVVCREARYARFTPERPGPFILGTCKWHASDGLMLAIGPWPIVLSLLSERKLEVAAPPPPINRSFALATGIANGIAKTRITDRSSTGDLSRL